jgi:hypothetical protein
MRKKTITQIIIDLLNSERWCENAPYEINNGDCEAFTMDIIDELGGEDAPRLFMDNTPPDAWGDSDAPEHCWVVYEGRFYDAECPGGVKTREELPIFVKWARSKAKAR